MNPKWVSQIYMKTTLEYNIAWQGTENMSTAAGIQTTADYSWISAQLSQFNIPENLICPVNRTQRNQLTFSKGAMSDNRQ